MAGSRFLWQIWGGLGGTLLLSVLLFSVLVTDQVRRDSVSRVEDSLRLQAEVLAPAFTKYLDSDDLLSRSAVNDRTPGVISRITLINDQGLVLADSHREPSTMNNHGLRPEILLAEKSGYGVSSRYSDTLGLAMLYVAIPVVNGTGSGGYLRLAMPLPEINQQMADLRLRLIVGVGVVGLALFLLGYFLVQRITAPVTQMTKLSRRIARGEYRLRLPDTSRGELGQLSRAINELARNAEQRIEEVTGSRNRLASVLAGLTEGVVAVDADQNILHINHVALLMLGLRPDQATDRKLDGVPAPREIRQLVSTCITERTDLELTLAVGSLTLQCSCRWMDDKGDDEVTGAILILEDVTNRSRLEEVRSDFVANASHELKTPISAIRGMVETIIDDPKMPQDVLGRFVDRIQAQTIRLDQVVQDLLQLSRFDSSDRVKDLARINLQTVMEEVHRANLLDAGDADVELRLECLDEPLEVNGEAEALNQMIANLVDNAIKYSEEGGIVDMKLSRLGSIAKVEVKDNGIGISKDDSERIFERFYRVDRARSRALGGTGLGLAIVKHIAQSHSGSVTLESNLGKGSNFQVQIPLAD